MKEKNKLISLSIYQIIIKTIFLVLIIIPQFLYAQNESSLSPKGRFDLGLERFMGPYGQKDYASVLLKEYVEAVTYEKGELLCYSIAYPIYLYRQSGRWSPIPISSPHHIYWRDAKYRRAMLEWILLQKEAFENAREYESDQSTLALYAQYPRYLLDAQGFSDAIEHCAIKYGLEKDSLKEHLEQQILFTNQFSMTVVRNILIEIPVSILLGGLIPRVFGILKTGVRWLSKKFSTRYFLQPSTSPLGLRGTTTQPQQIILQEQQRQFQEIMVPGFFSWSKTEVSIEATMLIALNYYSYNLITENQKSEEKTFLPPPTSPLPVDLLPYFNEDGKQKMRTWWNQKLEDYENQLIKRGLGLYEELTNNSNLTIHNVALYEEYLIWVDLYIVDYWTIKDKIDQLDGQIIRNQKAYRILRTTFQLLDLRKKQLERFTEDIQDDRRLNANHTKEHLEAIFKILEVSRETKEMPYSYCVTSEHSNIDLPPLCRFHILGIWKRLGTELTESENQDYRALLSNLATYQNSYQPHHSDTTLR